MVQEYKKYKFKTVLDPDGDGFFKKYIEAISTISPTSSYYLEIDYDLCAPMETWTLTHRYKQVSNGVESQGEYKQQVYHGVDLTADQVDMMVELVLGVEKGYLNFGEYIEQQ
jgi:hypothetical protein